jgi:type I restriction enzyme, S subunit
MGEWKEYRIEDVCSRITSGSTPSRKRLDYFGGTIPWLSSKEVNFNRINTTDEHITELGLRNSSAKWIDENAVIVAMYGATAGHVALSRIRLTTNQACCNLTADHTKCDYEYLFYFLRSKYDELVQLSTGVAQQNLSLAVLKEFPLLLPAVSEQRAIASVLSSLDAKIDLMHRQNKTLEAMAETLFRQWFVEEAEEGWPWVQLSEHIRVHRGLSYTGAGLCGPDEGVPMHNLNSVYEGGGYKYEGIKYYKGEYRERHIIKPGELIITNTEQGHDQLLIGCPAIIPRSLGEEGIFSQHVYRIEMLNPLFTGVFVKHLVLTSAVREQLTGATNGSTVNMLPTDGIEMAKFQLPPDDKIKRFNEFALPLHAKQETNHEQIKKLIALRDTLLPKLMSGEVGVEQMMHVNG